MQVWNARHNLFTDSQDEFTAILEWHTCRLNCNENFIRAVQAAPKPACILATDIQLNQLEINCTEDNFSMMSTDPTFNLGDFYVTAIAFKLKQFVRKHSDCNHVYLGLVLIHPRRVGSYSYFASVFNSLRPKLKRINAVGTCTDGESALFTTMLHNFPSLYI